MHRVIGKVTDDITRFQLNTSIAALMELTNAAYDYRNAVPAGQRDLAVLRDMATAIVRLLAPYVPHMAEELWREVLHETDSVHLAQWPIFDPSAVVVDEVQLVVQVNGKVRGKAVVQVGLAEEDVIAIALTSVGTWVEGKEIKKVVVVPGKLVSIVVAG
ncbi:MAG: class I tRNA ligase family protein, partial [Coriobacteriia bacterium]|nr:class I tRNA ligase family protein [Coriobacteriia bacterium]